jgi:uncharacterized membrane protein (Fun14 family)
MKKLNLEQMQKTKGGFLGFLALGFFLGMVVGYAINGSRHK